MRAFLLSFNDSVVARQVVINFLNTRPEVLNWYAPLQGGIFVISNSSAQDLAALVRQAFPILYFVIAELPRGYNDGCLPAAAWQFINDPKSSGQWST
jgi:hypothetical protein